MFSRISTKRSERDTVEFSSVDSSNEDPEVGEINVVIEFGVVEEHVELVSEQWISQSVVVLGIEPCCRTFIESAGQRLQSETRIGKRRPNQLKLVQR